MLLFVWDLVYQSSYKIDFSETSHSLHYNKLTSLTINPHSSPRLPRSSQLVSKTMRNLHNRFAYSWYHTNWINSDVTENYWCKLSIAAQLNVWHCYLSILRDSFDANMNILLCIYWTEIVVWCMGGGSSPIIYWYSA